MDTWIELGNARFVAASELSAASFRHPLCCCGCVKQPDPVNTRDIKAAYGRRGKVMPVGNPFCYHIVFLKLPLNHGFFSFKPEWKKWADTWPAPPPGQSTRPSQSESAQSDSA
jgi:hypothetical protein